jgi:hypothetical protein
MCPRHLSTASRRTSMKHAHSRRASMKHAHGPNYLVLFKFNVHTFFFSFVVDIYVGFAPASSNLASPTYNSPRSTRECADLLHTFHAFCHYTPVLPNILLAVEVGHCPLASSRRDIVVDRAGIRPLARQVILPLAGSDDSEQFYRVVRKCYQSAHHDGTCCKGSNPCSVNYNILPRRGHWTLANLLSQQNVMSCDSARGKNWSIMTKCMKSAG